VLGLQPSCSEKEIKTKYFELAKKYHPDLNKEEGAKEKFELINEAYSTLNDQTKRSEYDESIGTNQKTTS